jgi:Uma2 family endonuclease
MSYRLVDEASRVLVGRRPMAVEVAAARRLFTREEYHRMGEVGILKRSDRVELIRGEIVEMSPIGRRHHAFVDNLTQLLAVRLAGRAIVSVQMPIVLADDTEPEPDLAVYRRRTPPYKEREAHAEDALLLIEVAESSLAYDRSTKLRLYAAVGIPEYWVVDVAAESVEVYRAPDAGGYREISRLAGAASVSPLAFPDVRLTLAEIFA